MLFEILNSLQLFSPYFESPAKREEWEGVFPLLHVLYVLLIFMFLNAEYLVPVEIWEILVSFDEHSSVLNFKVIEN